jgi:hypothetical protein
MIYIISILGGSLTLLFLDKYMDLKLKSIGDNIQLELNNEVKNQILCND